MALIDEELIIADPFEFKNVNLIPVITGVISEKYLEILLEIEYNASEDDFKFKQLFRSKAPDFSLDEISIPVLEEGDTVDYKFTAITINGDLEFLEEGKTSGGSLILKIQNKTSEDSLLIKWDGPSFESEEIDYVRIEFKLEKGDGTIEKLNKVELSGDGIPEPISYDYQDDGILYAKIITRYFDGGKDKGKYNPINTKELIIKP